MTNVGYLNLNEVGRIGDLDLMADRLTIQDAVAIISGQLPTDSALYNFTCAESSENKNYGGI